MHSLIIHGSAPSAGEPIAQLIPRPIKVRSPVCSVEFDSGVDANGIDHGSPVNIERVQYERGEEPGEIEAGQALTSPDVALRSENDVNERPVGKNHQVARDGEEDGENEGDHGHAPSIEGVAHLAIEPSGRKAKATFNKIKQVKYTNPHCLIRDYNIITICFYGDH